jgi:hypothetical protein
MPITKQPQEALKFEIQTYRQPKDRKALRSTHVAFSGSPQRHPYDPEKIILVADPYSTHNFFYEFYKGDIAYVECQRGRGSRHHGAGLDQENEYRDAVCTFSCPRHR